MIQRNTQIWNIKAFNIRESLKKLMPCVIFREKVYCLSQSDTQVIYFWKIKHSELFHQAKIQQTPPKLPLISSSSTYFQNIQNNSKHQHKNEIFLCLNLLKSQKKIFAFKVWLLYLCLCLIHQFVVISSLTSGLWTRKTIKSNSLICRQKIFGYNKRLPLSHFVNLFKFLCV